MKTLNKRLEALERREPTAGPVILVNWDSTPPPPPPGWVVVTWPDNPGDNPEADDDTTD